MLKKLHRFQVFVAAVLVRHPFALFFAIIQIQHGCHRVHPQAVHVHLLHPEQSIGNEEIAHLIFPIIKNLRAPVGMLTLAGIRILVHAGAVKFRQPMAVSRKMGRYPVQDHADLVPVQVIDHVHEIPGRAVAGSGRVIARHLITPGTVKGMLGNAHQLHVGVAHGFHILGDLHGELPIGVKALLVVLRLGMLPPRAHVHFVNGQRFLSHIFSCAVLDPLAVTPRKSFQRCHRRRCSRPQFRVIGKRVCLVKLPPILCKNLVLVQLAQLHTGHKNIVNTVGFVAGHLVIASVPAVKIPHQLYLFRMGCPHSKIHTLFPVLYRRVRPQLLIDIIMGSLSEQILVKFRDFLGERQRCCLLSRLFIPLCLISHTFTSTRQELLLFLLYQCAKPLSTNVVATVHSYIPAFRFHACMKIRIQKYAKGAPFYEQNELRSSGKNTDTLW